MRRLRTAILAAMAFCLAVAPRSNSTRRAGSGGSRRCQATAAHRPRQRRRSGASSSALTAPRSTSPNPELVFRADRVTRTEVDGRTRFAATSGKRQLGVTIDERLCADTMTGLPFPLTVAVALDGEQLYRLRRRDAGRDRRRLAGDPPRREAAAGGCGGHHRLRPRRHGERQRRLQPLLRSLYAFWRRALLRCAGGDPHGLPAAAYADGGTRLRKPRHRHRRDRRAAMASLS